MSIVLNSCEFSYGGKFEQPITTGPLEGSNNKIKTLKRTAYGYVTESSIASSD
ncbi:MAG: transposase [Planctomycetaceae bacterium]|jgi:hypothetical protein|nr:transposase [Planctomycetaceae bacterium]